ncbi:MAG: hypothetical protein ACYDEP_08050 [Acidimicrobiales bacterium]
MMTLVPAFVSTTAMQSEVDGHEMPEGKPLAVWLFQLAPASVVVAMMPGPTAMQSEVDGHEIPEKPITPEGTVWLVQAIPPLVVAKMVPL